MRQVPFHVTLLPTLDTATPEQISEAVHSFLSGTAPISTSRVAAAVHAAAPQPHRHGASTRLALTPTTGEELSNAFSAASQLPFPLEYPRVRNAFAGAEPDLLHVYRVNDQHGHSHPIYVIVIDQGLLGQFYDVQGTNWSDPPLLGSPSQSARIGSRAYELYYAGERIRTIAWHEDGATYRIQNTLTNEVQPREMLAMAEQTLPVGDPGAPELSTLTSAAPHDLALPPRQPATTTLAEKLAAGLGLASIPVLAVLALLLLMRRRELRCLREDVALTMSLEARARELAGAQDPAILSMAQQPPTLYRARRRFFKGAPHPGAINVGRE